MHWSRADTLCPTHSRPTVCFTINYRHLDVLQRTAALGQFQTHASHQDAETSRYPATANASAISAP
jgi:hypothetical protein